MSADLYEKHSIYSSETGRLSLASVRAYLKGSDTVATKTAVVDGLTEQARQTAFTFAVIALSARLAQQTQPMSKQQYWVFREVFPISAEQDTKIRSLFLMAMNEGTTPEHYARQIVRLFPGKRPLYQEVLERLCKIAAADGVITEVQRRYLWTIAREFSLSRFAFRRMMAGYASQTRYDPYRVLDVSRGVSDEALKRYHMELTRRYHPDVAHASGASADTMEQMTSQLAAINAAYDAICRERSKKGADAKRANAF